MSNDDADELYVDTVWQRGSPEREQAFADIKMGKQGTELKVNIIPLRRYQSLRDECKIHPTMHRLSGYGGEQLDVKGTCSVKLTST